MISCQISYLPLGTERINEAVEQILEKIVRSGLSHEIGGMSTTVQGPEKTVVALVGEILESAGRQGQYVLDVRFSNTCGI